jgi:hypothetical protein
MHYGDTAQAATQSASVVPNDVTVKIPVLSGAMPVGSGPTNTQLAGKLIVLVVDAEPLIILTVIVSPGP